MGAASGLVLLPACSRTVAVTYPGNNVVQVPWRSCGMLCDRAFGELQTTGRATGKECEDLIASTDHPGGADDRVLAAALYDSAVLLVLQGKSDQASGLFTRASALDADPEYARLEATFRDAAQKMPAAPSAPGPVPPAPSTPPSAPAAPMSSAAVTPAAAPPAPAAPASSGAAAVPPSASALTTPR